MEKQKNKMFRLDVPTKRGVVLNGVLFRPEEKRTADTVMIMTKFTSPPAFSCGSMAFMETPAMFIIRSTQSSRALSVIVAGSEE